MSTNQEKQKILVVDDENRMRKLVHDFLVQNDYEVLEAPDGEEALKVFAANSDLSLIILDVMMPKLDGWQVLEEIRKDSRIPIIMLTAKSEEEDELHSFKSGADDYIQKPFSPKVLIARINNILKRNNGEGDIVECAGITINKIEHQVYVDGKPIELSFKEFELLEFLVENKDIALTREKILNSVWNFDYFGDARTIDTHIKKVRAKLGDKGKYITTIWGMGYKFKPEE